MDTNKHMVLAERILDNLAKRGIKEAEVSVYEMESSKFSWRDGRQEESVGDSKISLGVSLYREGRNSYQGTNDLRPSRLDAFLDRGVAILDLVPPDPYASLPDARLLGAADFDPQTFDPRIETRDAAHRIEGIKEMYEYLRSHDERVFEAGAWDYQNRDLNTRVYSNGYSHSHKQTWFDVGCSASLMDPAGKRPSSWYTSPTRMTSRLLSPEVLAAESLDRGQKLLGQGPEPGGTYDIILHREVAGWLVGSLLDGISGGALDQKQTIYEGRKGEAIGPSFITLREDPFIPGWYASRNSDWDGFPARRRDILRGGVLEDYLIGWYYSKKLGLPPNGGDVTNLVLEPGTASLEDLVSSVDKGILVQGFNGGNSNATTGDFSVGINGFLINNGHLDRPVNEMTMSGNFRDVWQNIEALGNEPFDRGSLMCPSIKLGAMTVAGI